MNRQTGYPGGGGSGRLPVSLLTGFLGSGKTTLLAWLVRQPELARTACIINEFGAVGLDHRLVAHSAENTVLLDSGCVCCSVRGDLVDTLRRLFLQRVRGEIPEFDRVIIETTGLADPAPVLHTLMADPLLAARFRLDGVMTTVDAELGLGQLTAHPESVKQVAVADRLLLTKVDRVAEPVVAELAARLAVLNPAALQVRVNHGELDSRHILNVGLYNPESGNLDAARWLRVAAYTPETPGCGPDCNHTDHEHSDHHHHHHHHHQGISAFCLTFTVPLPWEPFTAFIDTLTTLRGTHLLRMKGILNVVDNPFPVVVHGVQHLFYAPLELDEWPDDDRRSHLIFITRDLEQAVVERMLRAYLAGDGPAVAG